MDATCPSFFSCYDKIELFHYSLSKLINYDKIELFHYSLSKLINLCIK